MNKKFKSKQGFDKIQKKKQNARKATSIRKLRRTKINNQFYLELENNNG